MLLEHLGSVPPQNQRYSNTAEDFRVPAFLYHFENASIQPAQVVHYIGDFWIAPGRKGCVMWQNKDFSRSGRMRMILFIDSGGTH